MLEPTSDKDELALALKSCKQYFIYAGIFSAAVNLLLLTPIIYMITVFDRVISSGSLPYISDALLLMVALLLALGGFEWVRSLSADQCQQPTWSPCSGPASPMPRSSAPCSSGGHGQRACPACPGPHESCASSSPATACSRSSMRSVVPHLHRCHVPVSTRWFGIAGILAWRPHGARWP
jgi:hypothetical protein